MNLPLRNSFIPLPTILRKRRHENKYGECSIAFFSRGQKNTPQFHCHIHNFGNQPEILSIVLKLVCSTWGEALPGHPSRGRGKALPGHPSVMSRDGWICDNLEQLKSDFIAADADSGRGEYARYFLHMYDYDRLRLWLSARFPTISCLCKTRRHWPNTVADVAEQVRLHFS